MESLPEKLLYFIWGPGTPLLNTIGCIGGSWAKSKLEKFEHLLEGKTGLTAARTFWKKKKSIFNSVNFDVKIIYYDSIVLRN